MRRALVSGLLCLAALAACAQPALAVGGPGTIEGRVIPAEVATETEVCLLEAPPSETCTIPAPNGSYVLGNLPLGGHQVEFVPSFRSGYIPQYYNRKLRPSEAATVTLTAQNLVAGDVNAELVRGGIIAGEVTAQGEGSPLAEVEVCARTTSTAATRSCTETDSAGEYELHSLLPGSYRIGFWGHGASADYQPQYYEEALSAGGATVVTVAPGEEVSGIDAALTKGAAIEGSVSAAASGGPVPDTPVCLFAVAAAGPERCVYSDENGGYRFRGLPSGSYQIGFSLSAGEIGGEAAGGDEDGYLTQYFAGASGRSEAQTILLVAPGVRANVNAALLVPSTPVPVVPSIVPPALVPAPAPVAVPPAKKGCKRGYRKRKVKGKARCLKVHKKHRHHHRRKSKKKPGSRSQTKT